jgi:murein DD-endopeptidase MepM/ murein hydrolase activator NlpD
MPALMVIHNDTRPYRGFCHSALLCLLLLCLASCVNSSYLSQREKEQMLLPLTQKITDEVGGNYAPLIIKLDLLQLEAVTPAESDRCPVSNIFAAIGTTSITRQQFQQKLALLDEHFEQKRARHTLLDTMYRTTDRKISRLTTMIRNIQIAPGELRQNAVASADTLAFILADTDNDGARGSPYIPTGSTPPSNDLIGLFSKLSYLETVSTLADSIPILAPLPAARITSIFSVRKNPISGKIAPHEGIDFVGKDSAKVISAAAGTVLVAGPSGAYGNLVIIDHGLGITTRYAHLKKILVSEGNRVAIGQLIGIQGKTGRTTGPHLHYEVRFNEKARNPANYLKLGAGCSFAN